MGHSIATKCKCGRKEYFLGGGMMFPSVYREAVKDAKDGKFGQTMQTLMQQNKYAVMDVEKVLYCCNECGHVEASDPLDIYIAKDIESFKKEKYGDHTIEELGEVPYWGMSYMGDDECDNFIKIYTHPHECPVCKGEMRRVDDDYLKRTPCSKCGEEHEMLFGCKWD